MCRYPLRSRGASSAFALTLLAPPPPSQPRVSQLKPVRSETLVFLSDYAQTRWKQELHNAMQWKKISESDIKLMSELVTKGILVIDRISPKESSIDYANKAALNMMITYFEDFQTLQVNRCANRVVYDDVYVFKGWRDAVMPVESTRAVPDSQEGHLDTQPSISMPIPREMHAPPEPVMVSTVDGGDYAEKLKKLKEAYNEQVRIEKLAKKRQLEYSDQIRQVTENENRRKKQELPANHSLPIDVMWKLNNYWALFNPVTLMPAQCDGPMTRGIFLWFWRNLIHGIQEEAPSEAWSIIEQRATTLPQC